MVRLGDMQASSVPMTHTRTLSISALLAFILAAPALAQTAPDDPPPPWEVHAGASFVGTSGNSETTTTGADFSMRRRWPALEIESKATAVRTTDRGRRTADRYIGVFRAQHRLTEFLSVSTGERAERDRLAGIRLRSILDGGLTWRLLQRDRASVEVVTSLAWKHEQQIAGSRTDRTVGVLEAISRVPLGEDSATTQRFTYYPDFNEPEAYRSEAEITARAAMNTHLALQLGYLWRFSNAPVPGFAKTDNTTTASIVLQWRAAADDRPLASRRNGQKR